MLVSPSWTPLVLFFPHKAAPEKSGSRFFAKETYLKPVSWMVTVKMTLHTPHCTNWVGIGHWNTFGSHPFWDTQIIAWFMQAWMRPLRLNLGFSSQIPRNSFSNTSNFFSKKSFKESQLGMEPKWMIDSLVKTLSISANDDFSWLQGL